eukprot:symbB.v1.2.035130.t1/scaffold4662.1/size36764/2
MEPGVSQYTNTSSSWLGRESDVEPTSTRTAPGDYTDRTRPGTTLSISDTPRTSGSPPSRSPDECRTPPRNQHRGLPQEGFSPCCSAVSDSTSLAAEFMTKDIIESLHSVAYVSMALEWKADEDCSQTSKNWPRRLATHWRNSKLMVPPGAPMVGLLSTPRLALLEQCRKQ